MYIPRFIDSELKYLAGAFPTVLLTGPRQSGKSTTLKQVFPNHNYISLEDYENRQYANDDPRGFLADAGEMVIIDEAQYVPKLFSYLQSIIDASDKTGRYILSGSQNFVLQESITQSLAGRVGVMELLPLTLSELKNAQQSIPSSDEWLLNGGYPRLVAHNIKPKSYYPSYIRTYIERDIRMLSNIGNLDMFMRFIKICASRVGSVINYTDISAEIGIDYRTARSWVSILNASYITFELQAYYKNFGKRQTKRPKLYFYDTGLVCSLLNIETAGELNISPFRGHIFENGVVAEYMKRKLHKEISDNLYYWRSGERIEVDLLLEKAETLRALEIKSAQTAVPGFVQNLHRIVDFAQIPVDNTQVIYGGNIRAKLQGVRFTPWGDV